jgi:hypothetical protein
MFEIQINGLEAILRKCRSRITAAPMRRFLTRSAITVQGFARQNAPADQGQLRNDIVYKVDAAPVPLWARVGVLNAAPGTSLFKKASAMEYGTGLFAEGPGAKAGRHFPPPEALQIWAKRHGFKDDPGADIWHTAGGKVAVRIGRRGGLKPRRFLRNAMASSLGTIRNLIIQLEAEILAEWEKR